ncbi:MAG: prepilin-type N-terminal cleavage/methylation domain-containing protein [Bdellovibrionales bacterium]|nr:prepilin-type N-terminal cleavage/methylation domain-containing protein [Bdellovibrionales bacterium]
MKQNNSHGFSLLEMMIGMVLILISVMGFASMIAMQAQGNKVARGTDEAATLAQASVESLSNVQFSVLGTDVASPCLNGLTPGQVCNEGPLNRLGTTTGDPPFLYHRNIVICDNTTSSVLAGSSPQYCGNALTGINRPEQLACSTLTLTSREKMIRVLVSWNDKYGRCHHVHTDSMSFDWSGS